MIYYIVLYAMMFNINNNTNIAQISLSYKYELNMVKEYGAICDLRSATVESKPSFTYKSECRFQKRLISGTCFIQ